MSTIFIKINQTFSLDQKTARDYLEGVSDSGFSIQFNFAVKSGDIGFQVPTSAFVEGSARISSENKQFSVNVRGLAKAKIFEMQETQFFEKTPLYISGITVDGTYVLIPARPLTEIEGIKHDGENYPLAAVEVGKKKTALAIYP